MIKRLIFTFAGGTFYFLFTLLAGILDSYPMTLISYPLLYPSLYIGETFNLMGVPFIVTQLAICFFYFFLLSLLVFHFIDD